MGEKSREGRITTRGGPCGERAVLRDALITHIHALISPNHHQTPQHSQGTTGEAGQKGNREYIPREASDVTWDNVRGKYAYTTHTQTVAGPHGFVRSHGDPVEKTVATACSRIAHIDVHEVHVRVYRISHRRREPSQRHRAPHRRRLKGSLTPSLPRASRGAAPQYMVHVGTYRSLIRWKRQQGSDGSYSYPPPRMKRLHLGSHWVVPQHDCLDISPRPLCALALCLYHFDRRVTMSFELRALLEGHDDDVRDENQH